MGPGAPINPASWQTEWARLQAANAPDTTTYPLGDYVSGMGSNYDTAAHAGGGYSFINGRWYNTTRTGTRTAVATQVVQIPGPDGSTKPYYVAQDGSGTILGPYVAATGHGTQYPPPGGGGGPTWYEQQQIALDKIRIADAQKAQAFAQAQALEQQKIAQSNAVEAANQSFRDAQLKSTYGTLNGMAWASPKGMPNSEQLPEPLLLKEAYAAGHQVDPWSKPAMYGGYTGGSFMNAQQPGLANTTDPGIQPPATGPGSFIPPPGPISTPGSVNGGGMGYGGGGGWTAPPGTPPSHGGPIQTPNMEQMQQWHDIAHSLPAPTGIPSMATGGTVPGYSGQPQLIMAHGGETIIPADGRPAPIAMGATSASTPVPGYAMGGVVPDQTDPQALFNTWHDAIHQTDPSRGMGPTGIASGYPSGGGTPHPYPGGGSGWNPGNGTAYPGGGWGTGSGSVANPAPSGWGIGSGVPAGPIGSMPGYGGNPWRGGGLPAGFNPTMQRSAPITNAYGQSAPAQTTHAPTYNDTLAGPGMLNHLPYSPVLTGLSGYGATMTPNGTPVVMSNWQRSHLMPSSVSGPGGYDDYAMQVAGWNPADLQALGTSITGNFGTDLAAPKNYAPISVNPSPSGG